MPSYKLIYFNVRGGGELVRLLFAAAGVDYEDCRIAREDWPNHKPNMPMGKLPVLEIDGKQISQSQAIARYVAREFNLYGKTSMDQAAIDEVAETVNDLKNQVIQWFMEQDEEKKGQLYKKLLEEGFPMYLGFLEKVLERNNGGDGYFVGDKVSLADLTLYDILQFAIEKHTDLLDKFPKLKANRKRVGEVPAIATWLEKRPKTDH